MRYSIGSIKITYIKLIKLILSICIIVPLIRDIVPSASALGYIPDFLNVLLLILALLKYKHSKKIPRLPVFFILFLLAYDIIGLIFFNQGIILFLWGVRNQYRFFVFFLSAVILCDTSDINEIYSLLLFFLKINFFVVLIELLLGYKQDTLSGTFGITVGTNGSANLFLCVCFASLLVEFLYERIKLKNFLLYCFGIVIWAAYAELKYFIILVAIILLTVVFAVNKGLIKKFTIVFFGIIGAFLCIRLLEYVRPYYKDFFNLKNILWYAKHIDMGVGGFGRLNAISKTNEIFFNGNILKEIFGIGLGTAEYSSISYFDSPFHKQFGAYNYDTIFYAITYIERGFVGLAWYALFYISSFICCLKKRKMANLQIRRLLDKTMIVCVIAILLSFYDDSLRRASGGFIMFFLLAVPYICEKEISASDDHFERKKL